MTLPSPRRGIGGLASKPDNGIEGGEVLEPGVKVCNVSKVYTDLAGRPGARALTDVSLAVVSGEVLTVLGPNGAGKTTLMRTVCGLVSPSSGTVSIMGWDLKTSRRQALSHLGVLLEGGRNLYLRMTAYENVEYFAAVRGVKPGAIRHSAHSALKAFGLCSKAHIPANDLSRGMRQRLALAVALVSDPEVVVLDEPTLGLDVHSTREFVDLISKLAREGRAILLTTHQLTLAEQVSDRVCVISGGRVVGLGPIPALSAELNSKAYIIGLDRSIHPSDMGHLEVAGVSRVTPTQERPGLVVHFHGDSGFYNLMKALESLGLSVEFLMKEEPDLEQVFMRLVERGGGGDPLYSACGSRGQEDRSSKAQVSAGVRD